MPPEPSQGPVGSSPDLTARQRLHMHGIKEMPAGYDAEVAELFRDLRSASGVSEADLAARLATRVEVVQALEQGALYALPPWAETCRVVNGYGAMLNLDVRPLLRRIYAQIESGIVELGPKPIPDVPVMAAPEAVDFGFEPDKRAVRPVANFQAPDWPDNPFAAPPAKPAQPSSPPPQHAQRPQHAKPQAAAPQQNAWPQPPAGSPSPFQANWPNAAPSAPPPSTAATTAPQFERGAATGKASSRRDHGRTAVRSARRPRRTSNSRRKCRASSSLGRRNKQRLHRRRPPSPSLSRWLTPTSTGRGSSNPPGRWVSLRARPSLRPPGNSPISPNLSRDRGPKPPPRLRRLRLCRWKSPRRRAARRPY